MSPPALTHFFPLQKSCLPRSANCNRPYSRPISIFISILRVFSSPSPSAPVVVRTQGCQGRVREGEVGSWVNPDWREMHNAEDVAQDVQPSA